MSALEEYAASALAAALVEDPYLALFQFLAALDGDKQLNVLGHRSPHASAGNHFQ